MTRSGRLAGTLVVVGLVGLAACGKRGDPLPPLRPVPGAVGDLTATRTPAGVTIAFRAPAANADGTTPAVADRIDVFARTSGPDLEGVPAPSAVAGAPGALVARVMVDRPGAAPGSGGAAVPGGQASVIDPFAGGGGADVVRFYTAVAVAGGGAGRPGAAAPRLAVPMGPLPAPPATVTLSHDEEAVHVRWDAGDAPHAFAVIRYDGERVADSLPVAAGTETASLPVVFGQPLCVSVVAVVPDGPVRLEGAPSDPACLTPLDTFPPAAPSGLQAVQDGVGVTLVWSPVEATDLGGYVVLRGEGDAGTLQPLVREPLATTTYRDETVVPGQTYTYAVYAVDTAETPNISELSTRQAVVVR